MICRSENIFVFVTGGDVRRSCRPLVLTFVKLLMYIVSGVRM
jgi:hypothetical protein